MMDIFEILLKKRCINRCRSMYVKQNGNVHISKKVYCYKYSSSDTLLSSPKTQSIISSIPSGMTLLPVESVGTLHPGILPLLHQVS